MKSFILCALLLLAFVTPVFAQPSLSSLWPVDVGRVWEFGARVEGPFDAVETGIVTHSIVSQTELSSGVTIACFSVESTVSPAAPKIVVQPSMLLAVSECVFEVGFLVDDEVAMGVWSESIADWAWWWITADPAPGSTFRLPIRTEVADDAFVNGEVRTIDGAVTTPVGSFTNAVIVDYVVELGESVITDTSAGVIGTAFFETVGWIAFVPGVGPVASEEAFAPATIDCPACPPEIFETVTTTMELRATTPVRTDQRSFGSVKARY